MIDLGKQTEQKMLKGGCSGTTALTEKRGSSSCAFSRSHRRRSVPPAAANRPPAPALRRAAGRGGEAAPPAGGSRGRRQTRPAPRGGAAPGRGRARRRSGGAGGGGLCRRRGHAPGEERGAPGPAARPRQGSGHPSGSSNPGVFPGERGEGRGRPRRASRPCSPRPRVAAAPSPGPAARCARSFPQRWALVASSRCSSEVVGACLRFPVPGYLFLSKIHVTGGVLQVGLLRVPGRLWRLRSSAPRSSPRLLTTRKRRLQGILAQFWQYRACRVKSNNRWEETCSATAGYKLEGPKRSFQLLAGARCAARGTVRRDAGPSVEGVGVLKCLRKAGGRTILEALRAFPEGNANRYAKIRNMK